MARNKLTIFVLLMIAGPFAGWTHDLKGIVTSKDGTPIPYATIFIKEISYGTTTNDEGRFELDLEPGIYTANFRSLGYVPKIETINITQNISGFTVVLEEQIMQLSQIDIRKGEDPAYPIMRKVIGLSYVHLNQISSYAADVYIRGTVKFDRISPLISNQLRKKDINIKSGDVLVNETMSLINFIAPDKYEQRIRSINSTFPKVVDFSVDEFLGASLYQDNIDILFTPLGKNAFSHYNFRYEGFDQDGKYTVNKIRVIPKRKSKQLFAGYIYIIEDLWCLHRAELNFDTPFGEVGFRLVFDEVRPGIWLPVGHNYNFNGGMLGVKGSARFGASIKYNKIKVNDQVLAMIGITPSRSEVSTNAVKEPGTTKIGKNIAPDKKDSKISGLLEKEKLTNRDMHKLSKLMAREDKARQPDTVKSLEIKDEVKIMIEKDANLRDTGYWAVMRPIPLSVDEINSFKTRDSLRSVQKNANDSHSVVSHKRNYGVLNPLLFGFSQTLKDSTWNFKYDGLINSRRINFNAVDGWKIAQEIAFTKIYKPGKSLTLTPYIAYAINRRAILATGTVNYTYAPLKRGSLEITGGRNTFDYNPPSDMIHPLVNSVASLFFKQNFGRYYEAKFMHITNEFDISNGLIFTTFIKWNDITQLQNSTNFSFVNKDDLFKENIPSNRELTPASIESQINSVLGIKITYTPRQFYRIKDGVKRMAESKFPSFYLEYKKGIDQLLGSDADFDYVGAGMLYSKQWSSSSSIATELHSGWFPNDKQIHFSDFAHAQTQTSPVLLKEYRHSFYLPGYYSLSTSDKFVKAFISVKAPYIALKYLPVLSNTLWREMVWCSYYTSPVKHNYVEVGYTLLEVLLSANVGIFAGFDDGKYNNIGLNMSFRISY